MADRFPLLKFALFALVCLGFSAWLVATIGNISLEDRVSYEAAFADVTGLIVNDAVKVSGVTVGKVTNIELLEGGTALVGFEVNDEVPVDEDTTISVRWRDVFGLRFLYLEPGDGEPVEAGHRFPIEQSASPADLGLLLQRLVPVISGLDPEVQNQVLQAVSEALLGREEEVRDIISDGASLTQAIASRDEELGRLLENSARIFDAYAERDEELKAFIDSFADVSGTLAERNDTLEDAITEITDAQAELGDFVDRNDEELRAALDELDALTDILAVNRDNLAEVARTAGRGFVTYHYISRIGQWFNIRAVGASQDGETITTERGASLPPPQDGDGRGGASSAGGVAGAAAAGTAPASGPGQGAAGPDSALARFFPTDPGGDR